MKTEKGTKIWVPGEECDEGILVNDLITGDEVLVQQGETGKLAVPIKAGRFVVKPAVRGVLIGTGEKWALVQLASGHKIGVRIVAGWQLGDGDGQPPAAEFTPSDRDAPSDGPNADMPAGPTGTAA